MKSIKDFTLEELKKEFSGIDEPLYRAEQVFSWLYRKGASRFEDMTDLSKGLIDKLGKKYFISALELSERQKSGEGTEKFLFKLRDGSFIETVLIPAKGRKTLCLSTQVGCRFACPFCASGERGFMRNLTPGEITSQILFLKYNGAHAITNYVFMGMGEPLDNFENLRAALKIMTSPKGMDIGARRITVSTCGIIPGIKKLADLSMQINLSVSLHAADDELRDQLVPVNRRYPLEKLIKACEEYATKTNRLITLEYVLIKGENDLRLDAERLAAVARRLRAKVNLIACSGTFRQKFQPPSQKAVDAFLGSLVRKKVNVTLRKSRGSDIQAACGQLAGRGKSEV